MEFTDVRQKGFKKRIRLEKAIEIAKKTLQPFSIEKILITNEPISQRILREDLFSQRDMPPFDRSAVDGFAIIAEDTFGISEDSPVKFSVLEEVEIGKIPKETIIHNTAIQVSTGGLIPDGANAVLMIEDTTRISNKEILVLNKIHPKKNIARRGEDFLSGKLMFKKGHKFRSIDRSMLLAGGLKEIQVTKTPNVGILSLGDELVSPSIDLNPGEIPDINSISIQDLCLSQGWKTKIIGILKDERGVITDNINKAIKEFDIVLISGGTSVGKKDLVPTVLNDLGRILFHGLAMRPGGPVLYAKVKEKPVFGLPGFPTATIIAFLFVVKPIINEYLGLRIESDKKEIYGKITRNVGSKLGMLDFLRVKISFDSSGKVLADPVQVSGSGRLSNIIESDGIVRIRENSEGLKEGDIVKIELFSH